MFTIFKLQCMSTVKYKNILLKNVQFVVHTRTRVGVCMCE